MADPEEILDLLCNQIASVEYDKYLNTLENCKLSLTALKDNDGCNSNPNIVFHLISSNDSREATLLKFTNLTIESVVLT